MRRQQGLHIVEQALLGQQVAESVGIAALDLRAYAPMLPAHGAVTTMHDGWAPKGGRYGLATVHRTTLASLLQCFQRFVAFAPLKLAPFGSDPFLLTPSYARFWCISGG